ncbi:MAG: inositol monophosphatase [Candidatus Eisenbacteria bacterium]|nr:inositol monophosphatase [Candidatus Eisenbacteria bacterium]
MPTAGSNPGRASWTCHAWRRLNVDETLRARLSERTLRAERVAREAGGIVRERYGHPGDIRAKDGRELVTAADRESERLITDAVRERFPGDGIVAEESSPEDSSSGAVWIIDPLDGTNNFAHGYPFFSIAIACEVDGVVASGVVYDPLRGELFLAERGKGAYLNGVAISVSPESELRETIVATGFPYDRSETTVNNLANLNRLVLGVRGVRRGGSAELDLVYVACGRLDGFWELGLKTWDVSAGGLIVLEAGGTVTNVGSASWDHRRGDIVATNGRIHAAMHELIRPE